MDIKKNNVSDFRVAIEHECQQLLPEHNPTCHSDLQLATSLRALSSLTHISTPASTNCRQSLRFLSALAISLRLDFAVDVWCTSYQRVHTYWHYPFLSVFWNFVIFWTLKSRKPNF